MAAAGELRLELGVHRLWNDVELFWNWLDNAPSSIGFYSEIKFLWDLELIEMSTGWLKLAIFQNLPILTRNITDPWAKINFFESPFLKGNKMSPNKRRPVENWIFGSHLQMVIFRKFSLFLIVL